MSIKNFYFIVSFITFVFLSSCSENIEDVTTIPEEEDVIFPGLLHANLKKAEFESAVFGYVWVPEDGYKMNISTGEISEYSYYHPTFNNDGFLIQEPEGLVLGSSPYSLDFRDGYVRCYCFTDQPGYITNEKEYVFDEAFSSVYFSKDGKYNTKVFPFMFIEKIEGDRMYVMEHNLRDKKNYLYAIYKRMTYEEFEALAK